MFLPASGRVTKGPSHMWCLHTRGRAVRILAPTKVQDVGRRWWKLWKRDVREGWEILGRYRVSSAAM